LSIDIEIWKNVKEVNNNTVIILVFYQS